MSSKCTFWIDLALSTIFTNCSELSSWLNIKYRRLLICSTFSLPYPVLVQAYIWPVLKIDIYFHLKFVIVTSNMFVSTPQELWLFATRHSISTSFASKSFSTSDFVWLFEVISTSKLSWIETFSSGCCSSSSS